MVRNYAKIQTIMSIYLMIVVDESNTHVTNVRTYMYNEHTWMVIIYFYIAYPTLTNLSNQQKAALRCKSQKAYIL